jgi:hypothetical protein
MVNGEWVKTIRFAARITAQQTKTNQFYTMNKNLYQLLSLMSMKKQYHFRNLSFVISFFTLLFFTACKKNDPPQIEKVTNQISSTDSLSTFNRYLKAAALTDAEISGGVTLIAPSNSAFRNVSTASTNMLPDSSMLRDYVIKGILKESDFVPGKIFTTLSGKQLKVSVVADPIYLLNGVTININSVSEGDNFMVYAAAQLMNDPTPLFFTVWDATKWSSSKPQGAPAAQARVSLFHSREDYASSVSAAYTAVADNDGVAIINSVLPGQYYVVATKGSLSNVFSLYKEPVNGVYIGFSPEAELDGSGNFVWKDVNMDGRVDQWDGAAMQPALAVEAAKHTTSNTDILIGSYYKVAQTVEDAQAKLNAVYSGLLPTYASLVVIDGMLSDDASCISSGAGIPYCPFDNYSMSPLEGILNNIWNNAYFTQLSSLNGIIDDVPNLTADAGVKADLVAQAKVLRAYIYLELLTYFGEIPIHPDRSASFYPGIMRSPKEEVYNLIITDLTAAIAGLPATRADGKLYLTKNAAHGLFAKAALWKKDYNAVLTHTSAIINSASFTLTADDKSWLTNASTTETIWAPPFSKIGSTAAWYFSGAFGAVTVQLCPVLRYAQVLLMDAEAEIATGHLSTAGQYLNMVRLRSNLSAYGPFADASDANAALYSTWQAETYRQGDRFANLQCWGIAEKVLNVYGYVPYKNLLPIPIQIMNNYYSIVQNPGY